MKKLTVVMMIILAGLGLQAQTSEKYIKAMENLVPAVDTTINDDACTDMAGAFQRIGDAEKTQWLPYYYAAICHVNTGYMLMGGQLGGNTDKIDPLADKAEEMLNKAEALSPDNSEVFVVKKMINSLRLM